MFLKRIALLFSPLFSLESGFWTFAIMFVCAGSFCPATAQQVTLPNPSLPTPKVQPILNPATGLQSGLTSQEAQRREIQWVDEQIKKNDPMMRKIYGEPDVRERETNNNMRYEFPANNDRGKVRFENAFTEIQEMVSGRKPYSLKRAVYLTEQAYDTTLDFEQFERQIGKVVSIVQLEMKQRNILPNDNIGKIMILFKFMADTLRVKNPATEKFITTYPKTYDFEDFYGMQDYRKMFVSKLIKTGKGQCHSLPLLFLILCEELKIDAYLSYAPEHSYVKFVDKNGNLQNIELTNQMFTSDQFILQSGYISSAAIKSRVYMDTIGQKRVVLHTLNDLANNYVRKYRYDDFVLKCAETVTAHDGNNIHANMHLANYYNLLGRRLEGQFNLRGLDFKQVIYKDEKFTEIIRQAVKYGKQLDALGYAEMPPEMYANWLNSLKNESMKQEHLERKRILGTMIEH